MSDGDSPSVFAEHAFAFWSCPLGAALVSLAFSYPVQCELPKLGEQTSVLTPMSQNCTNFFGSTPVTLSEGAAGVIALAVGAVAFCVVWLIATAIDST